MLAAAALLLDRVCLPGWESRTATLCHASAFPLLGLMQGFLAARVTTIAIHQRHSAISAFDFFRCAALAAAVPFSLHRHSNLPISCNPCEGEVIYHPTSSAMCGQAFYWLARSRKHFGHWLDETSVFCWIACPSAPRSRRSAVSVHGRSAGPRKFRSENIHDYLPVRLSSSLVVSPHNRSWWTGKGYLGPYKWN